jgi:hypothetical protein
MNTDTRRSLAHVIGTTPKESLEAPRNEFP